MSRVCFVSGPHDPPSSAAYPVDEDSPEFGAFLMADLLDLACTHLPAANSERVGWLVLRETRLRAWLDATQARLLARVDELADDGKGAGSRDTARNQGRSSSREAKKRSKRSKTISKSPPLGDALAKGGATSGHVDAVGDAADTLPDDKRDEFFDRVGNELIDPASTEPVDAFRKRAQRVADDVAKDDGVDKLGRQKAATKLRVWVNPGTGMLVVNGELDPEMANGFAPALEAEFNRLKAAHADNQLHIPVGVPDVNDWLRARALVNLTTNVNGGSAAGSGGVLIPELLAIINYQQLCSDLNGAHGADGSGSGGTDPTGAGAAVDPGRPDWVGRSEWRDGTPMPAATARRLACDAKSSRWC